MRNFRVTVSHFDPGSPQNVSSPLASIPPSPSGNSKTTAFSPAVVAVIGVLAGAFLIVSYYRIFAKYCTRVRLPFWGFRNNDRDDSPSALVMEEQIWPPNAMGLEEALINRIPTCTYRHLEGLIEDTGCSVCLSEFEEEETLRILPKCNHAFHIQCIDTWLHSHSTCPLCRVNIVLAAGLPYALMPIDPQLSMERFSMSMIDEENHVLQEQMLQDLLQAQVSGANSQSMNCLPSDRSSFHTAPDVESPDEAQAQQIEGEEEITQRGRPSSQVTDTQIPIKEIYVLSNSSVTIHETSNLTSQASISGKKKMYSSDRHRRRESTERGRTSSKGSKGKGKHPVVRIPSPQMKRNRLSRMVRSYSSAGLASSSSSNQIVIELLAQEIFKQNVVSCQDRVDYPGTSLDTSAIFETSVRKLGRFSAPKGATSSEGSSPGSPHVTLDFRAPGTLECRDEDIVINVEDLLEREEKPWHLELPRDDEERIDQEGVHEFRRSCKSSKVMGQTKHCQSWPQKSRSMKTFRSMKLNRWGSGGPRTVKLSSFRSSQKVHASEPVFEIFDFL